MWSTCEASWQLASVTASVSHPAASFIDRTPRWVFESYVVYVWAILPVRQSEQAIRRHSTHLGCSKSDQRNGDPAGHTNRCKYNSVCSSFVLLCCLFRSYFPRARRKVQAAVVIEMYFLTFSMTKCAELNHGGRQ